MIRSLLKQDNIPTRLDAEMRADVCKWCEDTYVRFGTYGEPSLLPIDLVGDMVLGASSWTGYTHQARKRWATPYKAFFMAVGAHENRRLNIPGEDAGEPREPLRGGVSGGYGADSLRS